MLLVASLAAVGLRGAQPGDVLLQVGVDDADLLAGIAVGLGGLRAEHQRGRHQHRDDREQDEAQPEVDDQQRDQHADERQDRVDHGDQPGLQERGQRVHVRRHAGHDPAGQLALVEVEAEPLQVGEDLHPQRVEHPLAVAAHHVRLDHVDDPVGADDREADQRDHDDGMELLGQDAVVDAAADQRGHGYAGDGVEAVKDQADEECQRDRPQQPAQREMRVGGAGPPPG